MTYEGYEHWEADWLYSGPDLYACFHWDPNSADRYAMTHDGTHACDGCCRE